jgi:D-glycero-D-manno-heptose 1,7-bisphosphate phosphatase
VLVPGAAEALARLRAAGYRIAVYTNQSGVARGVMTEDDVRAVNSRLRELLAEEGAELDGVYVCPHSEADGCDCRKPLPGLVLRAARELGADTRWSWGVGDASRDLEAARAAGCRAVLVHAHSAPGERERAERLGPEASVPDLAAAADFILARGDRAGGRDRRASEGPGDIS